MRVFLITLAVLAVLLPAWGAEAADVTNVALNAEVTLHDGPFFTGGWCCGKVADPSTVVDGYFFGKSQQWDQGPVWWDARRSSYPGKQYITIDLGSIYNIESFIIQADDNDGYLLYYWNLNTNTWEIAWQIPAVGGWGMQTRPNRWNNQERYLLPHCIETKALLLKGNGGDWYYSVSEIQAFGYPVIIKVIIDIKPWSDPNSINIDSRGVIPVSILTTDDFDTTAVDPETVRFGPYEAYPEHYALEDVDFDSDIDMILHFRTQDTGIAMGDTEAVLAGATLDGRKIQGSDSVRVLESKNKKK